MRLRPNKWLALLLVLGALAAPLAWYATSVWLDDKPYYRWRSSRWWARAVFDYLPHYGAGPAPARCRSSLDSIPDWALPGWARAADTVGRPAVLSAAPGTVPVLLELAREDDATVRIHACLALGGVRGSTEAIAGLLRAVDDPCPLVRETALEQLAGNGPALTEKLPALLRLAQEDELGRNAALAALADVGPRSPEVVSTLQTVLRRGSELHPEALSELQRSARAQAARQLGRVAARAERDARCRIEGDLADAVAGRDPWVRDAAAEALQGLGELGESATQALQELRKHPDEVVRKAATEALGKLRSPATEVGRE